MPSAPSPGEPTPPSNAASPEGRGPEDRGDEDRGHEDRGSDAAAAAPMPTAVLIEKLQADRLWLLRQIDAGAWPQWRLDLAALERELGELLERVSPPQNSRD
jgi:hypothetical protein